MLILAPAAAPPGIAYVQGICGTGSTTAAPKAIFGAPVGAGNTVIGASVGNAAVVNSVTDDKGNTYQLLNYYNGSLGTPTMQTFVCTNITNGPTTITVTQTSSVYAQVAVLEYSGVASIDQHAINYQASPGTGTDGITSGSVTTTQNNEQIVGLSSSANGHANAAGTGFVQRAHDSTTSAYGLGSEDLTQSLAGLVAATCTGPGVGAGCAIVTLKHS